MSSYKHTLPEVFPFVALVTMDEARVAIDELLAEHRGDVPNGSSFAITVDAARGHCFLWLSRVSADFIDNNMEGYIIQCNK